MESVSELMVHCWQKDQADLFTGELKMPGKRKTMGCDSPKYPELDETLLFVVH